MEPIIYNFEDHKNGDTYDGAEIYTEVNDVPIDIASVRMQGRLNDKDNVELGFELSSDNGDITITGSGACQINKIEKFAPGAGYYFHDIEFTLADGRVKTYYEGVWDITKDVTRDGTN